MQAIRLRVQQRRRGRNELVWGWRQRFAVSDLVEHCVDVVEGFKHHIHEFGVHLALMVTQDVENVFSRVTAINQSLKLQEAGTTLYRVKATEYGVEQITVIRISLKIYQLL